MPVTITITLPDELAEQAEAKGLLSQESLVRIISEAVKNFEAADSTVYPPGFDPRLKGFVNPKAYGQGKIIGDIISPLDIEWETCRECGIK